MKDRLSSMPNSVGDYLNPVSVRLMPLVERGAYAHFFCVNWTERRLQNDRDFLQNNRHEVAALPVCCPASVAPLHSRDSSRTGTFLMPVDTVEKKGPS